jgi:hypothetical protein
LPQASEANRPGYEFQVGNVEHPITRLIPRGTTVKVFSMTSGGRLPCGFSQRAVAGIRVCSAYATAIASSARSCACGPPAWNAITNACPLVCMTAFASSKLRLLIRSTISVQTPARTAGPASRQAGIASRAAASSTSRSACG